MSGHNSLIIACYVLAHDDFMYKPLRYQGDFNIKSAVTALSKCRFSKGVLLDFNVIASCGVNPYLEGVDIKMFWKNFFTHSDILTIIRDNEKRLFNNVVYVRGNGYRSKINGSLYGYKVFRRKEYNGRFIQYDTLSKILRFGVDSNLIFNRMV